MFNVASSCPYEVWTSVAGDKCTNPEHFHCLKDDGGRIVWLCALPIWVEEGRCPVFNVRAKKLDTIAFPHRYGPPGNYRSNEIHVVHACINPYKPERSTTGSPYLYNEDWLVKMMYLLVSCNVLLSLVVLLLIIAIYRLWRNRVQNGEKCHLESASPMMTNNEKESRDEATQFVQGELGEDLESRCSLLEYSKGKDTCQTESSDLRSDIEMTSTEHQSIGHRNGKLRVEAKDHQYLKNDTLVVNNKRQGLGIPHSA